MKPDQIIVPDLSGESMTFTIYGTRPLLCQRLARDKSAQDLDRWPTVLNKVEDKLAWQYFLHYLYLDRDGDMCFPAIAVKKACIEAGRVMDGFSMAKIRGLFYINGKPPDGYIKLKDFEQNVLGPPPEYVPDTSKTFRWEGVEGLKAKPLLSHPFVDMVHMKQGGAVPVCYAMIDLPWSLDIEVEWVPKITNAQEIVNIIENAGKFVGIGPRRLVRSGDNKYGLFTLNKKLAIREMEAYQ